VKKRTCELESPAEKAQRLEAEVAMLQAQVGLLHTQVSNLQFDILHLESQLGAQQVTAAFF
jgi:hypothetical protein